MRTVYGKYNQAEIFTDVVEEDALAQIKAVCDFPAFADCKIRIMPDVHSGAGCTIGTTMTVTDKITPNLVGVDIGCGMEVVSLEEKRVNFALLDEAVRRCVPAGMTVRDMPLEEAEQLDFSVLRCRKHIREELAKRSLGTLGGGNHFIEVDRDDDGNLYLVVHSGSRHLGLEVAGHYQKQAVAQLCGNSQKQRQRLIEKMKAEGRSAEISQTLKALGSVKPDIPEQLAYVTGELMDDYVADMKWTQRFAHLNRVAITTEILSAMRLTERERFTTVHNYLDTDAMILRKGAVSAKKGEKLLIPINMRDGSLICVGKGNDDWNQSAPHGAGRLFSRGKARATFTLEQFQKEMAGVFSTSVCSDTLDESPMAYKSVEDIERNIRPTVDIIKRIHPVYNFKAAEQQIFSRKEKKQ